MATAFSSNSTRKIERNCPDLSKAIASSPDLLLSLTNRFHQHEFIDLHAKSSINRSCGLEGANMLLDFVIIKIEQSDQYIPLVMDILREEVALKDIVKKMEDDSNTMNASSPKNGATPLDPTPPLSPHDLIKAVGETISIGDKLSSSFPLLCYTILSLISGIKINLEWLKARIHLQLQYTPDNTPRRIRSTYLMGLEQCPNGYSVVVFLMENNLINYLNFDLLDSMKPVLSCDQFNDKLREYKLAHEQFIKEKLQCIAEACKRKAILRPTTVDGLPEIKVRLQNEWKGRSLYDWNEIMNDIIQWDQYIMIADVEMNCVTITYQILPFILPRVITDLTNDTIKKRFTSIGATFIIPEAQAMADDHKWIMDTIQEQQVMKKTRPNERGEDPVISGPDHTITDQPLEEVPPKEGGYDDEIFLTTPPNDLQCPVCHLTLREPHQLSCCGSTLCQVCSERSNAGIQCPCCRDTNHQIMVDKKTRRKVMSLQVKCTVTQCHWTGKLLDWNKHTMDKKKCPQPKGYDVSIFPEWCYHGLSSLQYEILPVYRIIKHFHKHKQNDKLFTDPFYTRNGGYKVTLRVDPNGAGSGRGTHVSVYIHLMKGPNDDNLPFPINGIFTVQMLNWKEDCHHIERSIVFDNSISIEDRKRVTRKERAVGMGINQFLSHNDVTNMNVLYEDMMCFKISYTPIIQRGCSLVPSWCDISTLITPPCTRTMYNYTAYKKTSCTWWSQPFYSTDNGYKLQLRVDANGKGSGEGTHLSLYVYLMKGDYDDTLSWPFNADIIVQLLNWSSDNHHVEGTIPHDTAPLEYRQRVFDRIRAPGGCGYGHFISHTKLQDTSDNTVTYYINDDNICFRIVSVDINYCSLIDCT